MQTLDKKLLFKKLCDKEIESSSISKEFERKEI